MPSAGRWRSRWASVVGVPASVAIALAALSSAAVADTLDEDRYGDAGSLPGAALPAVGNGPLTRIKGRLSSSSPTPTREGSPDGAIAGLDDFEDMFLIRILDAAGFSARTVDRDDGEPTFDTQLWLFSACALGQLANDDDPRAAPGSGYSVLLPASDDGSGVVLPGPGLYFLAISGGGRVPANESGPIFNLDDPFEISGPDGPGGGLPITAWIGIGATGAYQIELTGCAFLGAGLGDLDGDGVVDGGDLGVLLKQWGPCAGCVADFNGDGVVDGSDLGTLLDQWGPAPGPHFCGDDGAGECGLAHGTPFCEELCCCVTVCALDPFCCGVAWDSICAASALDLCADELVATCPDGATLEGERCGADVNGGCNMRFPTFEVIACGVTVCGTAWADGGTRDTDWYAITTDAPLRIVLTGTAAFPLVMGVVSTGGVPDCDLATALDPIATAEPLESVSVTACLPAGTHWLFVSTIGFDGVPCRASNDYVFTLECLGPCGDHGCGTPGAGSCAVANGSPYCDDAVCCLQVCAADPFCCEVDWDALCASQAMAECRLR